MVESKQRERERERGEGEREAKQFRASPVRGWAGEVEALRGERHCWRRGLPRLAGGTPLAARGCTQAEAAGCQGEEEGGRIGPAEEKKATGIKGITTTGGQRGP